MSLHSIKAEIPPIQLSVEQKRGIANFLYHYSGRYPVAYFRDTKEVRYWNLGDYWDTFPNVATDWAMVGSYGNHTFDINDIYILDNDYLPCPKTKEYVRHD